MAIATKVYVVEGFHNGELVIDSVCYTEEDLTEMTNFVDKFLDELSYPGEGHIRIRNSCLAPCVNRYCVPNPVFNLPDINNEIKD